jgi:flagellar protein FliS
MVYQQQIATYQMANSTLHKTRQLVLLYDAVIRFLKQAQVAIEEQRYEDRLNLLQKASNVIMGLHGALDYEKGGDISKMLDNFYMAMDLRILALNRSNNIGECEQITREIKMMRDAWDKIDQEYSAVAKADDLTTALKPTENSSSGSSFSA